jgi:hypothetical protein
LPSGRNLRVFGLFGRRPFGSGALATYNTAADVYNIYEAARYVPTAWDTVRDVFFPKKSSSKSSSSDSNDAMTRLALLLAVFAILGGILTTAAIVRTTAESVARSRRLKYAMD